MQPILMEGLHKAGCLCSMLQAVIHGPLQYAGLKCHESIYGAIFVPNQYGIMIWKAVG